MLEAGFWGLVGGVALVIGAVAGVVRDVPARVIGGVMAFGAGVLISALAFELTAEAFDASGGREVVLGLLGGALAFYLGDRMLDSRGGADRKMSGGQQAGSAAQGLVLGALLDGRSVVAVVSGLAALLGYVVLGDASASVLAVIQAFAAGAILTMLADTMIPEAYENRGRSVGLITTLGFVLAFLLSQA